MPEPVTRWRHREPKNKDTPLIQEVKCDLCGGWTECYDYSQHWVPLPDGQPDTSKDPIITYCTEHEADDKLDIPKEVNDRVRLRAVEWPATVLPPP